MITFPLLGSVHIFGVGTVWVAVVRGLMLTMSVVLFNLSQIPLTMVISTLFSDAKLGDEFGGLIFSTLQLLPLYLLQYPKLKWVLYLVFPLLPVCPWTVSMCKIINKPYFAAYPPTTLILPTEHLSTFYAWVSLLVACPLHLALYSYLDQVLPKGDYGVRKHPLFCLKSRRHQENGARIFEEADQQ